MGRKMTSNDTLVEVVGVTPDIRSTSLDKEPVNMLYIRTGSVPDRVRRCLCGLRWTLAPSPMPARLRRQIDGEVTYRRYARWRKYCPAPSDNAVSRCCWSCSSRDRPRPGGVRHVRCLSYAVTRRTGEMGIRMALGAERGDVLGRASPGDDAGRRAGGRRLDVRARLALSGEPLFKVSPRDPLAFAVSGAVLLIVSVAACLVSARRATRVGLHRALSEPNRKFLFPAK